MSIRPYKEAHPQLGQQVFIDESAVVIGNVTIGDNSSIWPNTTIRGDVNKITIGKNTNIQDNSVLHVTHANPILKTTGFPLIIGDNVTIGHNVTLHGCIIKNNILIGMGSIILDDTIIEDNTMIGAGSFVPSGKHLKGGYLYFGNPVKPIRPLTSHEIEMLEYSAQHYVRIKDSYME